MGQKLSSNNSSGINQIYHAPGLLGRLIRDLQQIDLGNKEAERGKEVERRRDRKDRDRDRRENARVRERES